MELTVRERRIKEVPVLEVVSKKQRNAKMPLVIFYHGWQTSKELNLTIARRIAQKSIRVIIPDAMNHGERKQPVSPIPSLTFWNSIQTNLFEFAALLNYFKRLNYVDDRIGVAGISMGGFTTCALMTHHTNIKVGACLMGTPDMVAYRERLMTYATAQNLLIPKDLADLTAWIPKYNLATVPETLGNRPLLIWHGTQDDRVAIGPVRKFVQAHPHLNLQYVEEEASHLVTSSTMDLAADFLATHLQAND